MIALGKSHGSRGWLSRGVGYEGSTVLKLFSMQILKLSFLYVKSN